MFDIAIQIKGMQVVIEVLRGVQTEKFITLIMREPFNYTEWQRDLWNDKSVAEISAMVMQHRVKQGGWLKSAAKNGPFTVYIAPNSIEINPIHTEIIPFSI